MYQLPASNLNLRGSMKNTTILLALLIIATTIKATTIKSIATSGDWGSKGAWDLNRLPANNDTVIIQANNTIKAKGTYNLNNIVLKVYGTLVIHKADLKFNAASLVFVYQNGLITGVKAGIIEIGGIKKFDYSNANVLGASYASSQTPGEPHGFQSFSVLPVKFIHFSASRSGSDVAVTWSTSEESNNSHFAVERSTDGYTWRTVGYVSPAEAISVVNQYSFTDRNMSSAVAYYRIKQVDRDGQFAYTEIKKVTNSNSNLSLANVYVSGDNVSITFNEKTESAITVRVISLNGHLVYGRKIQQSTTRVNVQLPTVIKGIYVVQVVKGGDQMESRKVLL